MSTTEPASLDRPSQVATDWLRRFDHALQGGDGAVAAQMFITESYWRDLVTFTWNIKTSKGRNEITAMLDATLPQARSHGWQLEEPATEADGVVSAWCGGMGRHRRAGGQAGDAAPKAARAGHRHIRPAQHPRLPGRRRLRRGAAPSSKHPGGDAWRGKKEVVIGSNNSAHDICADLWENGADVTVIQRTSTHIARSESLMELGLGGLYSEQALAAGITTERADMIFASLPYRIMHEFQKPVYEQMRERDAEFYGRLEKVGFMLDFGDDGSGLFMKYLRRGSGYYIDVGASSLIADGSIKLRSGVDVAEIREHSVLLSDGTDLPADLIVYATGYGSMNGWAARLISQEVADKVGKCWGAPPRTLAPGKASCATCGSRPGRRRSGSTAATCTSRAITRSIWRCSSRRGR